MTYLYSCLCSGSLIKYMFSIHMRNKSRIRFTTCFTSRPCADAPIVQRMFLSCSFQIMFLLLRYWRLSLSISVSGGVGAATRGRAGFCERKVLNCIGNVAICHGTRRSGISSHPFQPILHINLDNKFTMKTFHLSINAYKLKPNFLGGLKKKAENF